MKKILNLILAGVLTLSMVGCSSVKATSKSESKSNRDISWAQSSIDKFNSQKLKQRDSITNVIGESGDKYSSKDIMVTDVEAGVHSIDSKLKDEDFGIAYYQKCEGETGYLFYKDGNRGYARQPYDNSKAEKFLKNSDVNLGGTSTFEYVEEENLNGVKAIKVKATTELKKSKADWTIQNMGITKANLGKQSKEVQEAYKEADYKTEKSYLWFDAETHEILKIQTDDTKVMRLVYCISKSMGLEENGSVPKEAITVDTFKYGDKVKKIELPTKYRDEEPLEK